MILLVECLELALVADAASAVLEQLGVEYLLIDAVERCADAVVLAGDGLEVADDQHLAAVVRDSAERDHAVLIVVESDPAEAVPVVVVLVHRGNVAVERVRSLEEVVELTMLVVLEQTPFELLVGVPLVTLTDLTAHEHQLLAGVSNHVGYEVTDTCHSPEVITGHLVDERAFAVYDFIVRDGEDKVLGESIYKAEGQAAVMIVTPERIFMDIAEHIIHPAHVPLVVETECKPVIIGAAGNVSPCGTFFCDHRCFGANAVNSIVEFLEEVNSRKIFSAAVHIGNPFAVLTVIIEIKHGSNSIHTDTVKVIFLEPEDSRGDQEARYFITAVVEYICTPFLVFAQSPVLIFIAACAVETSQTVSITGEMCRYPVKDNADLLTVTFIDQIHQVLRSAVTGSGSIIARYLIAPASVKREFRQRHEFDMRIAHFLDIGDKLGSQITISHEAAVRTFSP